MMDIWLQSFCPNLNLQAGCYPPLNVCSRISATPSSGQQLWLWVCTIVLNLMSSQFCFGSCLLRNLFPWQLSFGNHSTLGNTVSCLRWWMTCLAQMQIMASKPPCHQLRFYCPFRQDSSHYIICIRGIWIKHQSLVQQYSCWTASAHLLMDCLTLPCFTADLVWNFRQRATLTSAWSHRSNLLLVLG